MAFGIPGTENINLGVGMSGFFSGAVQFIAILFLFCVVGGLWWFFFYVKKRNKKYNKKISWFEEIHGEPNFIEADIACELTIPGTNINVFYIKEKDMYLPRPVKRMGKDNYWFAIKNNREIVNFCMKNINEETKEAGLDYDHTDMRYALTNLLALIKRNYRDKSQPWWKEYKDVIATVVFIFVLTLSFIFIISKIGTLIDQTGALIDKADILIQTAEAKQGSGVIMQ